MTTVSLRLTMTGVIGLRDDVSDSRSRSAAAAAATPAALRRRATARITGPSRGKPSNARAPRAVRERGLPCAVASPRGTASSVAPAAAPRCRRMHRATRQAPAARYREQREPHPRAVLRARQGPTPIRVKNTLSSCRGRGNCRGDVHLRCASRNASCVGAGASRVVCPDAAWRRLHRTFRRATSGHPQRG